VSPCHASPRIFTIATGESKRASPSGRPHIALTCWSKLRGEAGIHGVVAAVVRARGDFVDQQALVFNHKKFHRHHAAIIQLVGNMARIFGCLLSQLGADLCGVPR